jgi:hypothetical protein
MTNVKGNVGLSKRPRNHESSLGVVAARLISQQQVLKKRLLSYATKVMRSVGGFIPLLTHAF